MRLEQYLQPLPDRIITILEDQHAKELAIFFGVFTRFRPPPPQKWMQTEFFEEHPTHWVAVQRHTGFNDPSEDGWSVIFFPKAGRTLEDFESVIRSHASRAEWLP